MSQHFGCYAAEQDSRNAVPTVRCHDDQIALLRFYGIDDRLIGMIVLNMHKLTSNACFFRGMSHNIEGVLRLR